MLYREGGSMLDFGQSYRKAADYCAIQDRCISELKLKLRLWQIDSQYHSSIISKLTSEGFIDEKRFALNYAGGKFRIKGWGKLKIDAGLRARSVPSIFIQQALAAINQHDYSRFLESLLEKKLKQLGGNSPLNRQKAASFAASRGFETGLIIEFLKDIEISE